MEPVSHMWDRGWTWDPPPGTLHLEPGTQDPGPIGESQDLGPLQGTWDPSPGTWDPGPCMCDTKNQSKKSDFVYLPQVGFIFIYIITVKLTSISFPLSV